MVVAAGQPVLSLAQDGARDIAVEFPEDRRQLASLSQAVVSLWAQPDAKYPAKLRELSAIADPVTRTFRARYSIDAPPQALALGQSATLHIDLPAQSAAIKLPTTALLGDHSQTKVWGYDPQSGTVKGIKVQVLGIDGNQVLIAGLHDGQQVVVAGVHVLIEGQKVRPLSAAVN
jgi:RND family efflux transporter MFP subunit